MCIAYQSHTPCSSVEGLGWRRHMGCLDPLLPRHIKMGPSSASRNEQFLLSTGLEDAGSRFSYNHGESIKQITVQNTCCFLAFINASQLLTRQSLAQADCTSCVEAIRVFFFLWFIMPAESQGAIQKGYLAEVLNKAIHVVLHDVKLVTILDERGNSKDAASALVPDGTVQDHPVCGPPHLWYSCVVIIYLAVLKDLTISTYCPPRPAPPAPQEGVDPALASSCLDSQRCVDLKHCRLTVVAKNYWVAYSQQKKLVEFRSGNQTIALTEGMLLLFSMNASERRRGIWSPPRSSHVCGLTVLKRTHGFLQKRTPANCKSCAPSGTATPKTA